MGPVTHSWYPERVSDSAASPTHLLKRLLPWAWGSFFGAVALPAYLSASTRLELEQWSEDPTLWTLVVVCSACVALGVAVRVWGEPSWRPLRQIVLSGAVAAVLGVGAYGWYVYWFSSATLASGADAPEVGTQAPLFSIEDPAGRTFALEDQLGSTVLLVFYRGHW